MDTALPQKFPFILDRNLAKANCTGNRVCTSCDIVVLDTAIEHAPIQAPQPSGPCRGCVEAGDVIAKVIARGFTAAQIAALSP